MTKSIGQKKTMFKILNILKKYSFMIAISIIFAAVSVGLTLYVPIIIGDAIDLIVQKGNVDFGGIALLLKRVVLVVTTVGILQWFMSVINNKITYSVVRDLRNKAFEKTQNLPLKYIDSHSHGDIVSRIIADVDQFSDGLLMGFTQIFTGIATIVGTLIFMVAINYKIALLVVCLTPISLFVAKYIATHTHDMFAMQSKIRGEQTGYINEIIGNQKVVKAFSREKEVIDKFDDINDQLEKYSLRAIFFSSLVNPCTRFVYSLIYAAVGLTGAIAVINHAMTVGALSCFLSYANQYTKPFNEISGVIAEFQNALACADRIFEFLKEQNQTPDSQSAHVLTHAKGRVELKDVRFSYTPDHELIKNFNLSVAPGERVAIVGPTGCGKTTLINLLMRFYDVGSGTISVDGYSTLDVTRHSLRKNYGMVLQDTWLKSGTIRENIAMGKPDATDAEIIEAAKASSAHSFIKRLPQGYDTVIGEDGGKLSQGQKQLLCIARVMLCLPPMLILDEATSSIDTMTEIRIQKAFSKLMHGKTSFIVAHRLSTIKEADTILVMQDGDIVEQGRHEQLLAQNGFYAKLYNSQFEH